MSIPTPTKPELISFQELGFNTEPTVLELRLYLSNQVAFDYRDRGGIIVCRVSTSSFRGSCEDRTTEKMGWSALLHVASTEIELNDHFYSTPEIFWDSEAEALLDLIRSYRAGEVE